MNERLRDDAKSWGKGATVAEAIIRVDGQEYRFDRDKLLNVELMAIERAIGMTTGQWEDALNKGSMTAATALVWIVRRRAEPGLSLDDVTFPAASLEIVPVEADEGKELPSEPAGVSS